MVTVITPPQILKNPNIYNDSKSLFLAGSIEMGICEDWQQKTIDIIKNDSKMSNDVIIFNPRRPDWDSKWEQNCENPHFSQQVNWELDHLEKADIIFMNFEEETKSPITLLELGLYIKSNIVVCCPNKFWRQGNVDIVCHRNNIPLFDNFDLAVEYVSHLLFKS